MFIETPYYDVLYQDVRKLDILMNFPIYQKLPKISHKKNSSQQRRFQTKVRKYSRGHGKPKFGLTAFKDDH